MIDREKVISGLQHCVGGRGCYDCPYTDCDSCTPFCKAQIMRDALELLKAQEEKVVNLTTKIAELTTSQEPVEPTIGRCVEYDGHDSWWYECGKCHTPIDPSDKYCRNCGRRLKWND